MADNNVNPKSQRELSQDSITPYKAESYESSKTNVDNKLKREFQRSVNNESLKKVAVWLRI